jgi:hypothetical protein
MTCLSASAISQEPQMERPGKFEHHQYVGDKRTQVVYDVAAFEGEDEAIIEELMQAETYLCFAPDQLSEARNRGYRLFRKQRALHDA